MSFLKRLFGRSSEDKPAAPAKSVEHKGFTVRATPFESGGRFQTAGVIEKVIGGERKEHQFIRADSHASMDQAVEFSLTKGCQIVDQVGENVFAESGDAKRS
jgi:hypothetical protein